VVIEVVVTPLLGVRCQSDKDSGSQILANQQLLNYIYEGVRLIVKLDITQHKYDTYKFTQENDFTFYESVVQVVDVSEHQANIDWQQVKDSGMEFAILRIGYRGMTEGGLNLDATFEQNYQGATAAGLKVGVYFFSQAITQKEAQEEAKYVLDA